jgi:DET1- and DDB1-associated protein 1
MFQEGDVLRARAPSRVAPSQNVSNFTFSRAFTAFTVTVRCVVYMQEQRFSSAGACALLQNLPRHPSAPSMLSAVKQTAPERTAATLYIATHDRTEPPADQVVSTERMNALMRQFHQREESRARERQKRAISSSPADDDREPARKASRKNAATATDEGSDGEALPRSGA